MKQADKAGIGLAEWPNQNWLGLGLNFAGRSSAEEAN